MEKTQEEVKKINVLIVEPEKNPVPAVISDTLEAEQEIVGGMIEAVYPFDDPVAIVCNEEGKINGMSLCIFIIIYGRMIEIYLYCSLGPIPLATMANREWGQMGHNYLRSLFALGFQGFLIMICVGIYAVLVQAISTSTDIHGAIWGCAGYTLLLCFSLFKTGSLARSIFNAH